MTRSGIFHLVALDDSREGTANDIIQNGRTWHLTEPFVKLYAVTTINQCLELPRSDNWSGEWLFILDCDLEEGHYGGFEAWSLIVRDQDSKRPAFAVIYSQKIKDLILSANKGGERAAGEMRPRLFERSVSNEGYLEPWWNSVLTWIGERQAALVRLADIESRAKIYAELRQTLTTDPRHASRVLSTKLDIRLAEEEVEHWTVGRLFPIQAYLVDNASNDVDNMSWHQPILEICYALLPQFPRILSNCGRKIFTDLRFSEEPSERHYGGLLEDTIWHAAQASPETRIYQSFCNKGVWEWLQVQLTFIKQRLEISYALLPNQLRSVIKADLFNEILDKMLVATNGGDMLEYIKDLHQYMEANTAPPWLFSGQLVDGKIIPPDARRDFVVIPVLSSVVKTIEDVINMQASEHGTLAKAISLKPVNLEEGGKRTTYCLFLTQKTTEGNLLDPEKMISRCKAEREDPQPSHLAGLVELVCGHYSGQVYVIQEPRVDRIFNPIGTAAFHAEGGRLSAEAAATLPAGLPEQILLRADQSDSGLSAIENFYDDKGSRRIKGTYYVLVFPHL